MTVISGQTTAVQEIRFRVQKTTEMGDVVVVVGDDVSLGEWNPQSSPMRLETDEDTYPWWVGTLKLGKKGVLKYKLVVLKADGRVCWEDRVSDRVLPEAIASAMLGVELTFDEAGEKVTTYGPVPLPAGIGARLFEVCFLTHVCTQPGDTVVVVGSDSTLGAWDPHSTSVRLETDTDSYPLWRGTLKICKNTPVQYKLVVLTANGRARWEDRIPNRALPDAPTSQDQLAAVEVEMKFDEAGEKVTKAVSPPSRDASIFEPEVEPEQPKVAAAELKEKDEVKDEALPMPALLANPATLSAPSPTSGAFRGLSEKELPSKTAAAKREPKQRGNLLIAAGLCCSPQIIRRALSKRDGSL
jgi:hypothetical protein